MKDEEKKKFESKLREEELKVEKQLSRSKENLDFGDDVDHGDEKADEVEEFGTWLGLKKVLEHHLQNVRRALTKFGLGNYGRCEQCGKEIETRLLEVDPESILCIGCKKSLRGSEHRS